MGVFCYPQFCVFLCLFISQYMIYSKIEVVDSTTSRKSVITADAGLTVILVGVLS